MTIPLRSNVPSLVCAFSAAVTTGGTIYAFGIYGDALKMTLQITQMELNTLSATFFVAGLLAWIPGMVVDKRGTRFSLMTGGLSGATFVMAYWALARRLIELPIHSVVIPLLFLLAVCICMSCALIIGSIFKITLLCGGTGTRGSAVGVAKGFVGLGSGVYACIFQALRKQEESALDFLPVVAFFFVFCASAPAFFLLPTKKTADEAIIVSESTPLHFRIMYMSLLVLGTVIVWSSIADLRTEAGDHYGRGDSRNWSKCAMILAIWLLPISSLLVLPRDGPFLSTPEAAEILQHDAELDAAEHADFPQDEEQHLHPDESTPLVRTDSAPKLSALDFTLPQMLGTPEAWLLAWICTILVGSGTYKTNNMGEMVQSLGFDDNVVPATLAIFSVAQMMARVFTGVVSEATLPRVPRTFYLVVACVIAAISHFALAFSTDKISFVSLCTLSALGFGMAWPLMVLIVGEAFGITHHGSNYLFYDGFAKAAGTLILSTVVAGTVYQSHTTPEHPLLCEGPACFRSTHLVVAALALTGVVASMILQHTTRHIYQRIDGGKGA